MQSIQLSEETPNIDTNMDMYVKLIQSLTTSKYL